MYLKKGKLASFLLLGSHGNVGWKASLPVFMAHAGIFIKNSPPERSGRSKEGCYPLLFSVSSVPSCGQKVMALLPFPTVSR